MVTRQFFQKVRPFWPMVSFPEHIYSYSSPHCALSQFRKNRTTPHHTSSYLTSPPHHSHHTMRHFITPPHTSPYLTIPLHIITPPKTLLPTPHVATPLREGGLNAETGIGKSELSSTQASHGVSRHEES